MRLSRFRLAAIIVTVLVAAAAAVPLRFLAMPGAQAAEAEVWKDANCGCCSQWIKHLEANGIKAKSSNVEPDAMGKLKLQFGIKPKLASCHTARIGGYTVEGHVPAADIKRLLTERPEAVGLTVPGMPLGSPGMEVADGSKDAYDVLLVLRDGSTKVWASYEK